MGNACTSSAVFSQNRGCVWWKENCLPMRVSHLARFLNGQQRGRGCPGPHALWATEGGCPMVQGEVSLRTGKWEMWRSLFSRVMSPTLAMANCTLPDLWRSPGGKTQVVRCTWQDPSSRATALLPWDRASWRPVPGSILGPSCPLP